MWKSAGMCATALICGEPGQLPSFPPVIPRISSFSRKPFQFGGGWERPVQPCSNVLLCFLMLLLAYKTVYFWYVLLSHRCKVHPHSHELVYKLLRLYIYLPKTLVSPLSPITHVPFVESPLSSGWFHHCQGYKSLEGTVTSVECGRLTQLAFRVMDPPVGKKNGEYHGHIDIHILYVPSGELT